MRKSCVVGILAHVDAGKTTLSEAMLFASGRLRSIGRVDHGDTFLDTDAIERERGITVFSKQARFSVGDTDIILLDTPGHVDFSAEAERTLQVLDYAILVISASDGVQSHTLTLWRLLKSYEIPTFIFVNKTDLPNSGEKIIADRLSRRLDAGCFPFYSDENPSELAERAALLSDVMLEAYESGTDSTEELRMLIAGRKVFPVFFGSALKQIRVGELLSRLDLLTLPTVYGSSFGARIYKIGHDGNNRLTYMKLTGGRLCVRDELKYIGSDGNLYVEKVSQIRLYSGEKFTQTDTVTAGNVCAVTGLSHTYSGQGLGEEMQTVKPLLEPVLTYSVMLPQGCDYRQYLPKLRTLEEEDPALGIVWNEETHEIQARLMGDVQVEILHRLILDRIGINVKFGTGKILYKETVASPVEGIGHFEPLRHYAEVHLLLEPLPEGSGIAVDLKCPPDSLATNWQRLIETNICEKIHRGVLIGAPITDIKITLIAGRAHLKHTEGGDFREATYRAIRQGLMSAKSVLLEPYYRYRLEVPVASIGKAMNDLQLKYSTFTQGSQDEEFAVFVGRGPAYELNGYAKDVNAYTGGKGKFTCVPDGYSPCHNAEKIISEANYDPCADLYNSPHSVFCAKGAGFVVPWDHVREYMHIETGYKGETQLLPSAGEIAKAYRLSDKQLEEIMLREFGPVRRREYGAVKPMTVNGKTVEHKTKPPKLIIDGYNVIFQWEFLDTVAQDDLAHAREMLADIISNYVSFTKADVILVFDAYRVKGNLGHEEERDGFRIVYTAQDETADTYIERLMYRLGPDHTIKVVTSDRLIQMSAVHSGIFRMSTREFFEEIQRVNTEITEFIRNFKNMQEQ